LYDRQRREVTHSFTQTQTKANMALIGGKRDDAHTARRKELTDIRDNDEKRRAYLMRQAMFQSLNEAALIK
jgi:3-(3-hydroxy-phenyl)propionate hydroxylase